MDSGIQKRMNKEIIDFMNDIQNQIKRFNLMLDDLNNYINDTINLRLNELNRNINNKFSYEYLRELLKTRTLIKEDIKYRINILNKLKYDLIIC